MNKETEFVDLVNCDGTVKKQGVPRSETDLYPDLHLQIVICVVFNKEGHILVHKRAQTKKVNPGDIDHVCGGVMSGESPLVAGRRESVEETGIEPINLRVIDKKINGYNRYRYLLSGESENEPSQVDPLETEWVRFMSLDELKTKQLSGEFTFVDEFFEETELVVRNLAT